MIDGTKAEEREGQHPIFAYHWMDGGHIYCNFFVLNSYLENCPDGDQKKAEEGYEDYL